MKPILRSACLSLLTAAALGLLAGCGSGVQYVQSHPTQFPEKDKNADIQVMSGSTSRPHVVLGTLTAKKTMKATFNDRSTYDAVVKSLKDYARKIGADALINARPLSSEDGSQSTQVIVTALAVRFMEQEVTLRSKD